MKIGPDKRDERGHWQRKNSSAAKQQSTKKKGGKDVLVVSAGGGSASRRWRRDSLHGGASCAMMGVAEMMTMTRRQLQCRNNDNAETMTDTTMAVASVGRNAETDAAATAGVMLSCHLAQR